MQILKNVNRDLRKISEAVFGFSDSSFYRYILPVDLPKYRYFPNSPEHKGSFEHAVDIAIPNPEQYPLTIHAPHTGVVQAGVLSNTLWGTKESDKQFLNWINVEVDGDEFYEIAHVAPLPGKIIKAGDFVIKGEPILQTALNGRITTTNGVPDFHLHILVGKWTDRKKGEFTSLKIRWER